MRQPKNDLSINKIELGGTTPKISFASRNNLDDISDKVSDFGKKQFYKHSTLSVK